MPTFDIGTVFNRFFKLMGNNFGVYALIGLVANILPFVVAVVLAAIVGMTAFAGNPKMDFAGFASNPGVIASIVVAAIVVFGIPMLISYSMIMEITILSAAGKPAKAGAALSNSFRNIFPLFVIALLVGLIILAGSLFFLIPGIFLSLCLCVAIPAYVGESSRGIFGSLSRSFALTEGKRWWLLLIHFVAFVLMIIFQLILRFGLMGLAGSDTGAAIVVMLISLLLSIVLSVAALVFSATTYVCLRESKEGLSPPQAADIFS